MSKITEILIGVDFDNTIVCYDQVFHKVAVELDLIPSDVPANKGNVRDYLRGAGKENAWIELQGYVYGARMQDAPPFPGALEFFTHCRDSGTPVCVISHRTLHPFRGPNYDLHRAAHDWLQDHEFIDDPVNRPAPAQVYFELTKKEKLERIVETGCTHFIDDLPEFLSEPDFPTGVQRILFDSESRHSAESAFRRVTSWGQVSQIFSKGNN